MALAVFLLKALAVFSPQQQGSSGEIQVLLEFMDGGSLEGKHISQEQSVIATHANKNSWSEWEMEKFVAVVATNEEVKPDETLPCHKIDINNDEEDKEEWVTQGDEEQTSILHDEMGKQKHKTSTQDSSKANHETSDFDQALTKRLCKRASPWKAFIKFCSSEMFPKEHCAELAVFSSIIHVNLLFILGHAYENLLRNDSETLLLSLGQASTRLFGGIMWNVVFILSFASCVSTVSMAQSLKAFRVPIMLMLCLTLLYGLSMWVFEASRFNVICGSFRMNGILFASLGVLGFILLYLVLVMLVLFASWRCTKQDRGVR